MNRMVMKFISSLLGICMLGTASAAAAQPGEDDCVKTELYRRTDVILQSSKEYENPYRDVQIDAVFTHESGEVIKLYGFWNGGDEWRVRFAPTKVGCWSYTVTCSDAENTGLHNVTGKILGVPNTGKTDIDRHGFIKVSENGRYFVHDDGTPFYWLGDTNWQAPNYVSLTRCNYPGCQCGNQFFHEVNDRVKKGFTVYQTYFDSSESDGGGQRGVNPEPSMWLQKYDKINPKTFRDKFDVMFDYLAAKGMVTALGFGVHSITVGAMTERQLADISRYLTARYAAYPVVWITAQEITGDPQFDLWVKSAEIVDAGDGYDHPQSAHQYPIDASNEFAVKLGTSSWHDFYALQNGHGPRIPDKNTYKSYWDNKPLKGAVKPFVETESNYEDIYCGGFNGYDASRISAWKANLCGSYGFTYGATGVWANCYSTSGDTGWMGTFSTEPWYMGIDKPGSYEMTYLADFFRFVGFQDLVPRFNSSSYSNFRSEEKVVASSEDGRTYVAYFYNTDRSTGELKKLNENEKYTAKWYDPLTGSFVEIASGITAKDGKYTVPEKPTKGDWALLVTSREDLGEYATEPAPEQSVPDEYENVLKNSKATSSSFSAAGSEASAATDGREDTWWCASDGSFPQWIAFDMGEKKSFNTVTLKMHKSARGAAYTVEASDDGKNWVQLSSGGSEAAHGNTLKRVLGADYSYRYLRIRFDSVSGSWAAVAEASAYAAESGNIREFGGEIQTPGVSCTGSMRYTGAGMLKDGSKYLTDKELEKEWTPFAAEATQTIVFDLYETKRVYGMNIVLGKDSVIPDYRIEGSADGSRWIVLKNTAIGSVTAVKSEEYGGRNVLRSELSGEYRYIKLIVMGAPSKDSVKTIAEIALYAEGATREAPESADKTSLLSLYKKYKSVKNDKKEYTDNRYRALLLALGDAAEALTGKADGRVASAEAALSAAVNDLGKPDDEIPPDDTVPAVTDAVTGEQTSGKPGSAVKTGIIAAAAAVAAAAVACVAAVIIKKKRK